MQHVPAVLAAGVFQAGRWLRPRVPPALVILLDGYFQLGGNLVFRRRPLEALFGCRDGGFDLLALRRFCRGAQSKPRKPSRMAPRILYSA